MKIDLHEIGASGINIERTIPAGEFTGAADDVGSPSIRLLSDTVLQLSITRAGERYHLQGKLDAEVKLECGRCLSSFSFAVRPEFDYYLVPRRQVDLWAELEIDETAKREVEVDSLELDLRHLVEEQVRLGLPMKPLCSESCQGICLRCGADLNRQACSCGADVEDTETGLSELSGLLERMKKNASEN